MAIIGRFALLLALVATGRALSDPLNTPESTVVLLVGLPGDTESENSYREQLQNWLRFLAEPSPPPKLYVFCDLPEAISLPQNLQAQILPANRANFLTLTNTLAGSRFPLLVVAWGHGGRQGAAPVLHVRGPRLTASDFSAVGAVVPESKWILLFRGSGAFAQALAGAGRQILSSESQTMFASDPIGMTILLKSLSESPTLTFDRMAQRLGSGTARWYSERSLARTEEPTLWIEGQKPKLLADSQEDNEAAVSAQAKSLEEDKTSPKETSDKPQVENPVPARFTESTPSAPWKQIRPVDPQQYPEVDGVILQQKITCTLGSNPAVDTEQEQYVQVLSVEGKRFGDFDVSYSPPAEEVEILDCEVLRPDGKLIRADADSTHDARENQGGDYQARQRRFFSLPGILPGAIVHVHYRKQWKEFPLPRISMALSLAEELPVLDSIVQVTVPKQSSFHFAFEDLSSPDPAVQQSGYSTSYSWHFLNCPPQSREVLTPPHQGPRLLFSTFADWSEFADWYGRITRLTSEASPEIVAKAKELTRTAATDREKVLAIYNYVTALRYVAVPLGVNSVRPHAAANVFRNQYGDCKDKANLLNALLLAVNIDSHLVLVPRFEQAYDAVPGLSFNHAISRVTFGSNTLWVDTTDDICRFGLLPPGDPGRKVLVIDGQAQTLSQLPLPLPEENRLRFEGDVDASTASASWPVKLKAVAQGYPDYQFREAARATRDGRGALPLMAVHWRPVVGSFAMDGQTMTSVSELERDFSWRADGRLIGLSGRASPDRRIVRSPFWLPKEWDLALHRRGSPLYLNQGYPLSLEQEVQFKLPARARDILLPEACENVKPPLRWSLKWASLTDNHVVVRLHAQLDQGELSSDETSRFQQQLNALLAAVAADAAFSIP